MMIGFPIMETKTFQNFQDLAHGAGLIFYSGGFDATTVAAVSMQLKKKLETEKADGSIKRKLFSTFIEMAQNVLHYGGTPPEYSNGADGVKGRPGAIALGLDDTVYWIVCGNLVPVEQIPRISERLNALRSMSLAEIKAAYRAQLATDAHESNDVQSQGAGLGLLTIARDSVHPIEFNFLTDSDSDDRFAYFYIKALI
jgi:hypothetical protein